jgi:hypothetical protein
MKALATESQLDRLWATARIEWPIERTGTINQYKTRGKELARWASLRSQGQAVKTFTDNIANAWLLEPRIFRPSKYATALKMRANVVADTGSPYKSKDERGHNLQKISRLERNSRTHKSQGTYTNKQRVQRHDEIKDFILKRILERDKGAVITREPILRSPKGEVLKPDLVVKNREGVFVVDVTVRHDAEE